MGPERDVSAPSFLRSKHRAPGPKRTITPVSGLRWVPFAQRILRARSRRRRERARVRRNGYLAGVQPRPELGAIEISADQHELVRRFAVAPLRPALVQREPPADEMEHVALVVLGDPNKPLAAIDVVRKLFEKLLKFPHGKRPLALKREGFETVQSQMTANAMLVAGMAVPGAVHCGGRLIACGRSFRIGEKSIGLEQPGTQHEGKRDPALRGANNARLRIDRADRVLEGLQPVGADQVALVEQNNVAMTELVARGRARRTARERNWRRRQW